MFLFFLGIEINGGRINFLVPNLDYKYVLFTLYFFKNSQAKLRTKYQWDLFDPK